MNNINIVSVLNKPPQAVAKISGSADYPNLKGTVYFYQTRSGVMVSSEISGLPKGNTPCQSPIFAFHIHSGTSCSGNNADYFTNSMGHYSPNGCPHPYHAGDMPPLFGADGYSILVFLSNRFSVSEIIGKTVIIHSGIDDFLSQPSGNSGTKIACGVITAYK